MPTGTDQTITYDEHQIYTLNAIDFGYSDDEGDEFYGITITPVGYKYFHLRYDGKKIEGELFVAAEDIGRLTWTQQRGHGQGIQFRVQDSNHDEDVEEHVLLFSVNEIVDIFKGTKRDDKVVGTGGEDIIDGRAGDDKLYGKWASDIFVFSTGYGKDKIMDGVFMRYDPNYDSENDMIDLSGLESVRNYRDLVRNHMTIRDDDIIIDGKNGDILVLKDSYHFWMDEVDKEDFIF